MLFKSIKNCPMKKIINYILALILSVSILHMKAQNTAEQSDDYRRIAIAPTLPTDLQQYPQAAQNILLNKMKNIVGLNGMSALEGSNIFIMYPQVALISSEITGTAPAMYALKLEVIFNVADFFTGNVYASASHEVRGVAKTEQLAYSAAFKQIPERAGKYKLMMGKAKNEILSYYNTYCDLVISRANSLAAQRRWIDALNLLNSVPPVCRDCFDEANLVAEIIAGDMPYILEDEATGDSNLPIKEIENADMVELGNGVFIRYKNARLIGDITTVYFELISNNEDDYDQHFYRIYDTFIINEKGEELRIKQMTVGKKQSNYYIKATLIPEVNTELVCEFPKVKEVKMLRFMINDNLFRFKNIVLTQ